MTSVFLAVAPQADVIVTVTDDMGMTVDRSLMGGIMETYHIRVGDTITLTCDNLRGEELFEIFTPLSGDTPTGEDTFVSMNVSVASFTNGTYTCSVRTPVDPQCPIAIDSVLIRLIGESSL